MLWRCNLFDKCQLRSRFNPPWCIFPSQDGSNIPSKSQGTVILRLINQTKRTIRDLYAYHPRIYHTRIKIAASPPRRAREWRFVLGKCLTCRMRSRTANTRASVNPGRTRSTEIATRVYSARRKRARKDEVRCLAPQFSYLPENRIIFIQDVNFLICLFFIFFLFVILREKYLDICL